ncbi:4Fe-4S binding protein [Thermodesulfatator atlanticus]|uniref:4Fe-4S binding protein n=1 Tax=Thermodesulfatator atlanticus TaxID=501497 RepID=UPI0003B3E19E|nr:4Fe-4S binding protein [Thermodesulfatator atlanticus]
MKIFLAKEGAGLKLKTAEEFPEEAVLLAAFSNEIQDETALFSPTLKVNATLGDFDHTILEKIALLEKRRFNENIVKTYTLDKRGKIIVFSKDPKKLSRFEEIYGGLLELFTISLGAKTLDHLVAEDVRVAKKGDVYLVEVARRLPIDPEKCSYCGVCGALCPEGAIFPELYIDFERCSLCNECVSACPEGAIDLHRYESLELEAPYLLFLEDPAIELPEEREQIFTLTELDKLLTLQGEHLVEELIRIRPGLCQHFGRLGAGCSKCIETCKALAITGKEEGISIDHFKCEGCGSCATCPSGAFEFSPFSDQSFFEYFSEIPLTDLRIIIAQESDLLNFWWWRNNQKFPKTFFLEYGRPNALTAVHLLYLWCRGAKEVILVTEENDSLAKEVLLANEITKHFWQTLPFKRISAEEFLTLANETEGKNPLKETFSFKSFNNRRKLLKELLSFAWESTNASQGEIIASPDFGEVFCDAEKCSLCAACLNVCQTGALKGDEKTYTLVFTPVYCIQCGACVAICPEKALELKAGLRLSRDFLEPKALSQTEPARCKECGKIFGTRKSVEKVRQILKAQGRFAEIEDLFDYCEDCRTIKMLEKGNI